MTTVVNRFDDLVRSREFWVAWIVIAVGLAAGAIVLGAGIAVALILCLLPFGAIVFRLLITNPTATAVVMIATEIFNVSGVESELPVSAYVATLGLGLVTIVYAMREPESRRLLLPPWYVCAGVAAYLFAQFIAQLANVDPAAGDEAIYELCTTLVFLYAILVLARLSGQIIPLLLAVVGPLLILCFLAVVNQVVFGATADFGGYAQVSTATGELTVTPRQGGPIGDSNFWGRHIILGLPIAGAGIIYARRLGQRYAVWIFGAALFVLPMGIYLTQSRGTYLSAVATMLAWIVLAGPAVRKKSLRIAPFLIPVLFVPGIGDRFVVLITDLASDAVYVRDGSVLGRTAAQEIAWAMFGDRPLFGFGPGSYFSQIPHYSGIIKTAVLEPTVAPHNIYAQIAAETGLLGLLGWFAFVAAFLVPSVLRALQRPESPTREVNAAMAAAILGWSAASVFLHLSFMRTFTVMLALACAFAISRPDEPPLSWRPVTEIAVRYRNVAALTALAAVAFSATLWLTASPAYRASQAVTLIPSGSSHTMYQYSIRWRSHVIPTYSAVMSGDKDIDTFADPVRGIVTVSSTGLTEDGARSTLEADLALISERLGDSGLSHSYQLNRVGDLTVAPERRLPLHAWGVAAVVALVTVGAVQWVRRSRNEPPKREESREPQLAS